MMKRILFIVFIFIAGVTTSFAQSGKVSPKTNIKKGVLKNGMTYYIYHNPVSRGKANFYLVQDVGAILEEDTQNGLAHFLEHMAFKGTTNYPGNSMMEAFEKKGLIGSINAYTGIDQTVYHFTNIPSADRAFCDECLLMLYDWSNSLLLEPVAIDAERPVIIEEMRTRNNLRFRANAVSNPILYNYSKYGERDIIGTKEVLQNFKYKELEDFYNTWYRTDLQAVVVIGDIDAAEMETKVKNLFSRIPAVKNPKERYHIVIPDNKEVLYTQFRDNEIKGNQVRISYRHEYTPSTRNNYLGALINNMLRARAHKLLKDDQDKGEDKIFMNMSMGFTPSMYAYSDYSVTITADEEHIKEALKKGLGMHKHILNQGFTQEEFDKEKERLLEILKRNKKVNGLLPNDQVFNNIKENFLNNLDLLDPSASLNLYTKMTKELTLDDLKNELNTWFSGPNKAIIVSGDEKSVLLSKEEVLALEAEAEEMEVIPGDDDDKDTEEVNSDLLGIANLKGSEIINTEKIPDLLAEKWTLANGATVVFKENPLNNQVVNIMAESPGGLFITRGVDRNNATLLAQFSKAIGLEGLSLEEYENLVKQEEIQRTIVIGENSDKLLYICPYASIENMFQMLYAQFEKPAFYSEGFEEIYPKLGDMLKNRVTTYKNELQDSMNAVRYGKEQVMDMNKEWYESISLENLEKVYKDRFQDASNFTFYIVGGIGKARAKKLAEKYIGSISSTQRKEDYPLLTNKLPQGRTQKTFEFETAANKAGVVYKMNVKLDYNLKNRLAVSILRPYVQNELFKIIRGEENATYGVHATTKVDEITDKNCEFDIRFECDPTRVDELDELLHQSVKKVFYAGFDQAALDLEMKKYEKAPVIHPSKKNNVYYINVLASYLKSGVNPEDGSHFEEAVKGINKESLDELLRYIVDNATILDVKFH